MTSYFGISSLLRDAVRNNLPKFCWTIALTCLGLVTFVAAPAVAQPGPFDGKFNHYQCYDTVDWGKLPEGGYTVADQFRKNKVKIVRPLFLCNPVDKNGEGIPAPEVHLLCYETVPADPDKETYSVAVGNQVEDNRYTVRNPHILCVPSKKERLR